MGKIKNIMGNNISEDIIKNEVKSKLNIWKKLLIAVFWLIILFILFYL